jgi:hypothetical protein
VRLFTPGFDSCMLGRQKRRQMTDELPETLDVSLSALAELAVEWWRLERWAGGSEESSPQARHAARRLGRFLSEHGLEVLDVTGRAYEPGLAVEVLDAFADAGLPAGTQVVDETVAPVVLYRGAVVRHGQVVVRRN